MLKDFWAFLTTQQPYQTNSMDKELLNDALLQSELSISMNFMCAYVAMEIMTATWYNL